MNTGSALRHPASLTRRRFLQAGAGFAAAAVAFPLMRGRTVPPAQNPIVEEFDADRAFSYLMKQVEFGPRPPGSRAHVACRDYLRAQLENSLGNASLQPFELDADGCRIRMWNVLSNHDPESSRQVLLCAHWDTRPTADKEEDPEKRTQPILGANDGASGVAVLLEIASIVARRPPPVGVRFVLFDGEDYGPNSDRMYLGAKHYAKSPPKPDPEWGVLLDMVGDKDLGIWRERNSEQRAPGVNDRIWEAARATGHEDVFHNRVKWSITDDHLPLLDVGIPIVDLIDFDYRPWHTLEDTVDKCSPESLLAVGQTVLQALYES